MKNKFFLLLLCLPLLAGCAAQQERSAKKRIQSSCDRLMGCTEEEVVLTLGSPQKIDKIGELKIYQYHNSYGTRSNRRGYVTGLCYGICGVGKEKIWEAFDKIEIFFKNGYATSWKSSVKR